MGNLDNGFLLPYAWLPLLEQLNTADERWETLCALIDRQRYNKEFPHFDETSLQYSICTACEPTIIARIYGHIGGISRDSSERNAKTLARGLRKGASEPNKSNSNSNSNSMLTDDVREIVSYLNEKTGQHYNDKTQATVRLIHARLGEGFSVDDFRTVINTKASEWMYNPEMKKFLRPQTLFGTKFESYLNQNAPNACIVSDEENDILPY